MKTKIKVSLLILMGITVILVTGCRGNQSAVNYEFANITRRTLERTISASGTINPVSTVRVLPQMSGKVENIFVSNNDIVSRGDVLAELNTDMLRLRREQQYAAVLKARANYELQLLNYQNQQILAERDLISEFELRQSHTNLNNLAADLAMAESNLRQVDTEINQFAFITSPIDGIVLERRVNVGDSVVDGGSGTSGIFTLAENLNEMHIEVLVSELDITLIRQGQSARFSLESMPGRTFMGVVESIYMTPVVSGGVVSYTVIVKVDNLDGSLFPGMTCAVDFIVDHQQNVLVVPSAALRYEPTNLGADRIAEMLFVASLENMSEEQQEIARNARNANSQAQNGSQGAGGFNLGAMMGGGGRGGAAMMGGPVMIGGAGPGAMPGAAQERSSAPVMRNMWFINGQGILEVMQVQVGLSVGTFTEIYLDDSFEGKEVILRERV